MKNDFQKNDFQVSDFYLAVFLKSKGVLLTGIKREGQRTIFYFDLKSNELILDFYNNKALVKVNDFVQAMRDMKSLIHSKSNL